MNTFQVEQERCRREVEQSKPPRVCTPPAAPAPADTPGETKLVYTRGKMAHACLSLVARTLRSSFFKIFWFFLTFFIVDVLGQGFWENFKEFTR